MDNLSKSIGTILSLIAICFFGPLAQAKYSGGTGEPNDPYQIATTEDLMLLGETPEDYDKHFILTADIDLDPNLPGLKVFDKAVIAPDTDPTPNKYGHDEHDGTAFNGVFDGGSHTISHLGIQGAHYLGLFGKLDSGAEVRNLDLVGVNVDGSGSFIGGLVGENWRGNVSQCRSTGMVSGTGNCIGGLVGKNSGSIARSHSTGSVAGGAIVGGLAGCNQWGSITECDSSGTVSGNGCWGGVGGLLGSSFGDVSNCYSTSIVSGAGQFLSAGGLVGRNEHTITTSFGSMKGSGLSSCGCRNI